MESRGSRDLLELVESVYHCCRLNDTDQYWKIRTYKKKMVLILKLSCEF